MQRMIEQAVEYAMKRMKVWQKLGFLGIVFLIPLTIFSYKMIASMRAMGIGFAEQERIGVEYLMPLYTLLEDLQQHRDRAAALLNGESGFAERMIAKRGEVLTDLRLIDTIDQRLGATLQTTERWTALRKRMWQLVESTPSDKAQENFQRHTALIEELLSFMAHIGDRSKLVLDPDLDSAYLIDLVVRQIPQFSESLSQARGIGAGIAARKSKTDDERLRLSKINAFIEVRAQEIQQEIEKALAYNHRLSVKLGPLSKTLVNDEGRLVNAHAHQLLNNGSATTPIGEYFETATASMAPSFEFARQVGPALDGLLRTRITRLTWELYSVGLWIFVGVIVVLLIGLVRTAMMNLASYFIHFSAWCSLYKTWRRRRNVSRKAI